MGVPHAGMPYQWGTIPRGVGNRRPGSCIHIILYIYTYFRGMVAVLFFLFCDIFGSEKLEECMKKEIQP